MTYDSKVIIHLNYDSYPPPKKVHFIKHFFSITGNFQETNKILVHKPCINK